MFIPPHLLARAEILSTKFLLDRRDSSSDDALANTIGWLIETFTIQRSLALTLAIGRKIGGEHCIRVVDDEHTRFALIAEKPHLAGSEVSGTGIMIFGRALITDLVRDLSGESAPPLQVGIALSEGKPDEQDEALVRLASLLPWYRDLLERPICPIDASAIVDACLELGMPEDLIKS
jgi:hypothetical protein